MNYARIYEEFIQDRLTKQPEKPEYFETHHIVPRSFGGCDDAGNLIRLTPEDHYFAHMVLAHVYGGKMWHAAMAMARLTVGKRNVKRLQQRVTYGIARRKSAEWFSENMSGENSPTADKTVYTLRHKDGRTVTGRRFELAEATGLLPKAISNLVNGKRMTCYGWFSTDTASDCESLKVVIRNKRHKDKLQMTLYKEDGSVWTGIPIEFKEQFGIQPVFQSNFGHCKGWFRSRDHIEKWKTGEILKQKIATNSRGDISGHNNPRSDKAKYKFVNLDTGVEHELTRVEMRAASGASVSHIQRLVSGQLRRVGSWAMANGISKCQRGEKYRFVCDDGQEFVGSKNAISKRIKASVATVEKLISSGECKSGWKWDGCRATY